MAEVLNPIKPKPVRSALSRNARNVVSNWAGFIFASVVNFFLSPFVVHHLGNSAYGVWVLMGSLTGYLGLLDLGVRSAVTRYVAKFHTQSDHQKASRVTSSALAIFTAAGVLAISVSLVLVILVVPYFHIPEAYQAAARIVLLLTGVNVAVSLISGVFGGILVGLQKFELSNLIEVLSTGLRAAVIVVALYNGEGLVALGCIQLFFSVATGVANTWVSLRSYPRLQIRIHNCDWQHLRLIFSFSFYAFLIFVFDYIVMYTDSVVIGAFLPVNLITFFAIAASLVSYARVVVSGISRTAAPLASALEAEGDERKLQGVVLDGARYATALVLPIGLTFMVRGKSFIGLWMGPGYAEPSGRVLWILTLAFLFSAGTQVAASTMLGISKHKAMVPVSLAEALCNLAISLALVRSWGIDGVAWGTTLPRLAVCLLFWPWYVRRTLGIPIRLYVVPTWIRPLTAALPFTLCTYAIDKFWPTQNLFLFFVQVGVALPTALLGSWYVCLTRLERETYGRKLKGALGHGVLADLGR